MEASRSPLIDLFRRGEVPADVRLLAAQGAVAPRAEEQLALLVLLADDPDPEVARVAEQTLRSIPPEKVASLLTACELPEDIRSFLTARGMQPSSANGRPSAEGAAAAETGRPLIDTAAEPESAAEKDEPPQGTVQRIAAMTVAQRVQLAMKGSREERAVLIRDPNKLVGVAVLSSPKLTETEVETIARMATIPEELIRMVANQRSWMKRYGVVVALVRNPKTPVAISMNLLARLTERDLRSISADRNVPEVLRITARQKVVLNR